MFYFRTTTAAVLLLTVALASPSEADTVKFYTGTTGYQTESGVPFNGVGTVYRATESTATNCPTTNTSCGANDIRQNSLKFNLIDGLTITATVDPILNRYNQNTNQVWDDLQPHFGGLGVGVINGASDTDQVDGNDILTLTFKTTLNPTLFDVTLNGIATLFDSGHTPFGTGFATSLDVKNATGIAFLLSVDGAAFTPISFADANNSKLNLTGHTFAFEQITGNPEFYVSALSYCVVDCTSGSLFTPLPAALPLFVSGLGTLGLLGWRRKRKAQAAA